LFNSYKKKERERLDDYKQKIKTLKKKNKNKNKAKQNKIYLQDEGSLILQYKGQMDPCDLNKVPKPETRDEEKLCLPVSIRRYQGLD